MGRGGGDAGGVAGKGGPVTAKQRSTVLLKAVHDAPQRAPWFAAPIGLLILTFGFYRIWQHPAGVEDPKLHMAFDGGIVLLGLLALPGFMPYLTKNAASLVALWKQVKKPPSGDAP